MSLTPTQDLEVVTIGEAVVTLATDVGLSEGETLTRAQSGDALIAAVQAARLGAETAFVTRVGDDPWGDWLLESWEREGLHLDFARRVHGLNALCVHSRADGLRRAIRFSEGAVAANLDRSDIAALPWRWTRVVYTTGSTQALGPSVRDAIAGAFETAREAGATTVFDPTLRAGLWPNDALARGAFEEVLQLTDVLVISAPFATGKLLGQAAPIDAARRARRHGVERVFVREGHRGVVVAHGDLIERIEGAQGLVSGVEQEWAEAAFNGALCAALARRAAPSEAADSAMRAMSGCGRHNRPDFERLVSAADLGL